MVGRTRNRGSHESGAKVPLINGTRGWVVTPDGEMDVPIKHEN